MRLEDVWFRYPSVRRLRGRFGDAGWVLSAVDLDLAPGRAAVVLGRNGVGKSTLLQLAAGVLRPQRGVVRDRPPVVGWVPERFPADQPFTVDRYLTSIARVRGLTRHAAVRAVDDWVARLGLGPHRAVRLPQLSKGTAQKVGLAQALLRPPGLLVLDEPWEGLDAETRHLVPELVAEVLAAGGSVLVSDHRGETARLPRAWRWTVHGGTVSVAAPEEPDRETDAVGTVDLPGERVSVVEVAVAADRVTEAVAALRAAGHQVVSVRPAAGASSPTTDPPPPPRYGAAPKGVDR